MTLRVGCVMLQGKCLWAGANGHKGEVVDLWVDYHTGHLFTGGSDASVFVWNLATDACNNVRSSAATSPKKSLGAPAVSASTRTVRYFGACHQKATQQQIATYFGSIAYEPDGRFHGSYQRWSGDGRQHQAYVSHVFLHLRPLSLWPSLSLCFFDTLPLAGM